MRIRIFFSNNILDIRGVKNKTKQTNSHVRVLRIINGKYNKLFTLNILRQLEGVRYPPDLSRSFRSRYHNGHMKYCGVYRWSGMGRHGRSQSRSVLSG